MPTAPASFQVTGDKALMRALHALPIKVYKKVTRAAVKAAMRPVRTAAKRTCDARSGKARAKEPRAERKARQERGDYRLSESIDVVARTYKGGETAVGIVGPMVHKRKIGRVGHLIEHGHKMVLWGKPTGGRVEGQPFMAPAWDASKGRAKQVLIEKLRAGIEREAKAARQESGR